MKNRFARSNSTRTLSRGKTRRSGTPRIYGGDRIGLVSFDGTARTVLHPVSPFDSMLEQKIRSLPSLVGGDGTNLTDSINESVALLRGQTPGVLRRCWLLSDGQANRGTDELWKSVAFARESFVNINTIAFGDDADASTLNRISRMTHNGRLYSVSSLRQLSEALVGGSGRQVLPGQRRHRSEVTVFAIDVSPSMGEMTAEGRSKIAIVQEAMLHLVLWKQRNFA